MGRRVEEGSCKGSASSRLYNDGDSGASVAAGGGVGGSAWMAHRSSDISITHHGYSQQ